MNAKNKLEAIQTPAQLLRGAIARRDSTVAEIETIRARANHFAPIEAEVGAAEAALQTLLQQDAAAMQAWADAGATAPSPDPDHNAREAAARKVSDARAKLHATGGAKARIEAETREAHGRHQEALQVLRAAEAEVLGQELIRSAHAMKAASLAYLDTEQHYFNARQGLFAVDAGKATVFAEQAGAIATPMNIEQEREFGQQAFGRSQQRLASLIQGNEVAP